MRSSTYITTLPGSCRRGLASRLYNPADRRLGEADMHDTDIQTLRRILHDNRTIAVVGLSANWYRPSFFAAKYMMEHGYRIIPVNPQYQEVLGQKCYPSLRAIPDKVDIVDCFQKTERILSLA